MQLLLHEQREPNQHQDTLFKNNASEVFWLLCQLVSVSDLCTHQVAKSDLVVHWVYLGSFIFIWAKLINYAKVCT